MDSKVVQQKHKLSKKKKKKREEGRKKKELRREKREERSILCVSSVRLIKKPCHEVGQTLDIYIGNERVWAVFYIL